jgi:hypothetical protein
MKKLYTLVGLVVLSSSAMAQAPYMYANQNLNSQEKYSPITTINNRIELDHDRAEYYSEDFDSGYNGWVNDVQTGPVGFELTSTGHGNSAGNSFVIPDLASSTNTQWIVLDSDGENSSYDTDEEATLNSQKIDLTAATGEFVALEFEQFFAEWQPTVGDDAGVTEDHCYIAVSTDSTTWTEIEINEGVDRDARPNPEVISWDITDFIASNIDSVWVRFRWEGAWNYGWQLDNIKVVDLPEKDVEILQTWRGYDSQGITYSQVPQNQASEFIIGAVLKNSGHLAQTNVTFEYEISAGGSIVDSGTATDMLDLLTGEKDTILHATGFTPTAIGDYEITWTVISTEGDDNAANDVVTDNHFKLTDYIFATDYNQGAAVPMLQYPNQDAESYFGNLVYFQADDVISGVDVKIIDNQSNVGEEILVEIFGIDTNSAINPEWLRLTDQTIEFTVREQDLGNFVSIAVPDGLEVDPTKLYLVAVGYYGIPDNAIFERQGDIGWGYLQGFFIDTDGSLGGASFFDRKAPIVRVRLNEGEVGINENEDENEFSIYPNPTNNELNVNITPSSEENSILKILDVTGKVVRTIIVSGSKTITLNVEELSTGVYFLELTNASGKEVKKFIKK